MDQLSVYHDYTQTMAMLRAARNRVFNTFDTESVLHNEKHGNECVRLCQMLYDTIVEIGLIRLKRLHLAMKEADTEQATAAANALHRHNRKSARLTRLFGDSDIADFHPNTDDFYLDGSDVPITPPDFDATKPVGITKFLTKLIMEVEQINRDKLRARAVATLA